MGRGLFIHFSSTACCLTPQVAPPTPANNPRLRIMAREQCTCTWLSIRIRHLIRSMAALDRLTYCASQTLGPHRDVILVEGFSGER